MIPAQRAGVPEAVQKRVLDGVVDITAVAAATPAGEEVGADDRKVDTGERAPRILVAGCRVINQGPPGGFCSSHRIRGFLKKAK